MSTEKRCFINKPELFTTYIFVENRQKAKYDKDDDDDDDELDNKTLN